MVFIRTHSQRENTEHWHLGSYRLWEDDAHRAGAVLHWQDRHDARGVRLAGDSRAVQSFISVVLPL